MKKSLRILFVAGVLLFHQCSSASSFKEDDFYTENDLISMPTIDGITSTTKQCLTAVASHVWNNRGKYVYLSSLAFKIGMASAEQELESNLCLPGLTDSCLEVFSFEKHFPMANPRYFSQSFFGCKNRMNIFAQNINIYYADSNSLIHSINKTELPLFFREQGFIDYFELFSELPRNISTPGVLNCVYNVVSKPFSEYTCEPTNILYQMTVQMWDSYCGK